MRFRPAKQLTAFLALFAFLVVTLSPVMPQAQAAAQPCAMMLISPSSDGSQAPDDAMPVCGSNQSCIVAMALPAPMVPEWVPVQWSRVVYAAAAPADSGFSIAPEHRPPIILT